MRPDIAAEMLITAGDNTNRIRSDAALGQAVRRLPDPGPAPERPMGDTG